MDYKSNNYFYNENDANNEDDRDLKRRKEAELLLLDELPPQYIKGFVVYNKEAKQQLLDYKIDEAMIAIRRSYYF